MSGQTPVASNARVVLPSVHRPPGTRGGTRTWASSGRGPPQAPRTQLPARRAIGRDNVFRATRSLRRSRSPAVRGRTGPKCPPLVMSLGAAYRRRQLQPRSPTDRRTPALGKVTAEGPRPSLSRVHRTRTASNPANMRTSVASNRSSRPPPPTARERGRTSAPRCNAAVGRFVTEHAAPPATHRAEPPTRRQPPIESLARSRVISRAEP